MSAMKHFSIYKLRFILFGSFIGLLALQYFSFGEAGAQATLTEVNVSHEFEVVNVEYQAQPMSQPDSNNVLLVNFGEADFFVLSSNSAQGMAQLQACEDLALKAMGSKSLSFVVEARYVNVDEREARMLGSTSPLHVNIKSGSSLQASALRCFVKANGNPGDQATNAPQENEGEKTGGGGAGDSREEPPMDGGDDKIAAAPAVMNGGGCALLEARLVRMPRELIGTSFLIGALPLFLKNKRS